MQFRLKSNVLAVCQWGSFEARWLSLVAHWRWVMLGVVCINICVSYLPYYAFVPILRQTKSVYGVDEFAINLLCVVYALVFVPGAFVTGPVVARLGLSHTLVFASGLVVCGCLVRAGFDPSSVVDLEGPLVSELQTEIANLPYMSFSYLLLGQTLCACGQVFFVNSTSELAAQWFPPDQRPAAAMISNLMNFLGGSLSFMLPTFVVSDDESLGVMELQSQVVKLLRFHLGISILSMVLTIFSCRSSPARSDEFKERLEISSTFRIQVGQFIDRRDFWLVNFQFMGFVAACHAFDAVEGSLLERYDYSASLTAWTAVSCLVASVLSTMFESWFISDPGSYKPALLYSNFFLAASQILAFFCLTFRWHQAVFVIAVGIMGLATPGWGCSCELGSEVAYPAQEATVTSLMEAFGNLVAAIGIVLVQHGLDRGLGASVLLILAVMNLTGGGLLFGLSGTLQRQACEIEAGRVAGQLQMEEAVSKNSTAADVAQIVGYSEAARSGKKLTTEPEKRRGP